jgi:phosphatidylglycerophosphatase A
MTADPRLAQLVAGCFGLGSLPRFYGTAASLAALVLAILLMDLFGRAALILVAVGCFAAGMWATELAMRVAVATGGRQDTDRLVIADFAGLLLALIVAPANPAGFVLTLLAFRLFVAARPWPIHWYDLGFDRGRGAMLDAALSAVGAGGIVFLSAWALGEGP